MPASLHVSLPEDLRRFVDSRAGDSALYATPSEYVRDLIRRDMQRLSVEQSMLRGLDQAERDEFVADNFLDRLIDDIR